jgi:uncharacterized membrane protein
MRTRLRHLWEVISSGYWFVPTVMSVAAVAVAVLLLYVDRRGFGSRAQLSWLYAGGADGAKTLLSAVAGSVITVAGVAFSITIAALSQASSQFGPRLLRNFMRDTGNQVVLGTFVATFLYCLLILRTIHGEIDDGQAFVPQASVTFAVLLAGASIAVLIYFIHHVSVSLQAPAVVAAVAADLKRVIARLADEQDVVAAAARGAAAPAGDNSALPPQFEAAARAIASTREGYVQAVDYDGLVKLAETADLVMRLEYRPGDHVIQCATLARVWPAERCAGDLDEQVNAAFICGRRSTPEQDVEFAIRQLVEIAVRALSPGVNDPFTAINCIDALAAALCRVARHSLRGPHRHDNAGKLRLVTPVTTFSGITDTAFNQIRQYGRGSVAVTIRLLEVIAQCAEQAKTTEQREALLRHARMVYADAGEAITSPWDRADVRRRWEAAVRALGGEVDASPRPESSGERESQLRRHE